MQSIMGRTHIKKCATSMHPTQPPTGRSLVPSDPGMYVMLCYGIVCLLCYAIVGCFVVPCPNNFSAQSDPVSFCASDNKRLVTCNYSSRGVTIGGAAGAAAHGPVSLGVLLQTWGTGL